MFSSVNTCWTLVAAFLVYFMQAGFALCEAGFTRAKNTGNILMKNMMDFCIGTPCYWVIGFGLMFGGTSALLSAPRMWTRRPNSRAVLSLLMVPTRASPQISRMGSKTFRLMVPCVLPSITAAPSPRRARRRWGMTTA